MFCFFKYLSILNMPFSNKICFQNLTQDRAEQLGAAQRWVVESIRGTKGVGRFHPLDWDLINETRQRTWHRTNQNGDSPRKKEVFQQKTNSVDSINRHGYWAYLILICSHLQRTFWGLSPGGFLYSWTSNWRNLLVEEISSDFVRSCKSSQHSFAMSTFQNEW